MASAMAGQSSGNEAMVLSRVYEELSKSMDIEVLNTENINNIFQALDKWERTIDWIHHNEAHKNGVSYFFFTLNKTLYKFFSIAFSNPRIEIPDFARSMKKIIKILQKIDGVFVNITETAKEGLTDGNIEKIKLGWNKLYGEHDGQEDTIMNDLKKEMETFLELTEKSFNVEGKPPILNSTLMMPYDTSIEVLKMHIPILNHIKDAYWEWEKQLQLHKEKKAQDEVAKAVILSAALDKKVKDKLNNFLFLSSPYKPDFIMVGHHDSERGKVKSYEYTDLVSLERNNIVNMPRNVFGAFYDTLSKDMQLVILKILQLSDLSIRRGEYMDTGKLVEDINTPGHMKKIKERIEVADSKDILETFRLNLKRFFLNITIDKDRNEISYSGVATRNLGVGQIKMLRRLKYISSSDESQKLFKKIIQDKKEMKTVADYIQSSDFQIFKFTGAKTTGGKRRRKRKTRRRKKKTTKRKKTRRRKRTKRRKKTRKSKRKKTKRRRRR